MYVSSSPMIGPGIPNAISSGVGSARITNGFWSGGRRSTSNAALTSERMIRSVCSIDQTSAVTVNPSIPGGDHEKPSSQDSPSSGSSAGFPTVVAGTLLPLQSNTSPVTEHRHGSGSWNRRLTTSGSKSSRNAGGRNDVPHVALNSRVSVGVHASPTLGLVVVPKSL